MGRIANCKCDGLYAVYAVSHCMQCMQCHIVCSVSSVTLNAVHAVSHCMQCMQCHIVCSVKDCMQPSYFRSGAAKSQHFGYPCISCILIGCSKTRKSERS